MYNGAADLLRGVEWLRRGKFDEALQCLEVAAAAIPRDPRMPQILSEFARITGNKACAEQKNITESIRLNKLAIHAFTLRADTTNDDHDNRILTTALFNLGATMQRLGRKAEAMTHYRHVLALTPENQSAVLNLTALLVQSGGNAECVQLLSPLVEKFPDNEGLTAQLIRALQEAHQMDEAVTLAVQAAARFPDLQMMYFGYYYRYTKGGEVLTA
jgi:tetratricopeptide (TPR) repeat protein